MQNEGIFEAAERFGKYMFAVERFAVSAIAAVDAFVEGIMALNRLRGGTRHSVIIRGTVLNRLWIAASLALIPGPIHPAPSR